MANLNEVEIQGFLSNDFVPEENEKIALEVGEMAYKDLKEHKVLIKVIGTGGDNLPRGLKKGLPCAFKGNFHVTGKVNEAPVVEFRVQSVTVLKQLPKTDNRISFLGRLVEDFKEDGALTSRLVFHESNRWGNFVNLMVPEENAINIPRGLHQGTLGIFNGYFSPEECKFTCVSARVYRQPNPVQEEPDYLKEPVDNDGTVDGVF